MGTLVLDPVDVLKLKQYASENFLQGDFERMDCVNAGDDLRHVIQAGEYKIVYSHERQRDRLYHRLSVSCDFGNRLSTKVPDQKIVGYIMKEFGFRASHPFELGEDKCEGTFWLEDDRVVNIVQEIVKNKPRGEEKIKGLRVKTVGKIAYGYLAYKGEGASVVTVDLINNVIRFKLDEKSEVDQLFFTAKQMPDLFNIIKHVYQVGKRGKEK